MIEFKPGLNITPLINPLGFKYGDGCFGPSVENRNLNDIRRSLLDFQCDGPEVVYSIAMDVGKRMHKNLLERLHLLYGVVTYAEGQLGQEPIRSQGHIHATSQFSNGWSTPEVYEIWKGKAVIYMQETANDNPGRCFAVYAEQGDVVIVPPSWAHATISADPDKALTFGAWCVRDYAFVYDEVRAHKGLAWFPILNDDKKIRWKANSNYSESELITKSPEDYEAFGINPDRAIYEIFESDSNLFDFVVTPEIAKGEWENFIP